MKKSNIKENDKSKIKFKALDIVIILLILASFVGIYFRYSIMDLLTGSRNLSDHIVSFEIKDVRYSTEPFINVGDKVYAYDDGSEIGTLIQADENVSNALIVNHASKKFVTNDGSKVVDVHCPPNTRIDASGRMICKGRDSENGFLLGGTKYLTEGDTISVKTELVSVDIIIVNIEPVNE